MDTSQFRALLADTIHHERLARAAAQTTLATATTNAQPRPLHRTHRLVANLAVMVGNLVRSLLS